MSIKIQIGIPVYSCIMSNEYFTRTSLYLVRLNIFEWMKFLRRHLHQMQCGLWIHGSLRMQECRIESKIYNYHQIYLSNNKFTYGILWGYAWPGLTVTSFFLIKLVFWVQAFGHNLVNCTKCTGIRPWLETVSQQHLGHSCMGLSRVGQNKTSD